MFSTGWGRGAHPNFRIDLPHPSQHSPDPPMNPRSAANPMLQPLVGCAVVGLVAENRNKSTRHYRHGFAFVRKDWTERRRAEIVME